MKEKVIQILEQNRIMAIATIREDGWPQSSLVSFANEDLILYFVVSRSSQKLHNIVQDDRISIAIGQDFHDPSTIKAVSIAAHASEVRDAAQRRRALELILTRHPGLRRLAAPEPDHSAVMRAYPSLITVADYSQGFGHADLLTVGAAGTTEMTPARTDDWGFGDAFKRDR